MSHCLNPNCQKPASNPPTAKFCQSCGTKLLLKDRYRAIKLIGQGGFGKTFLAVDEDKPSKPPCVIKQFFLEAQGTNNTQKAAELFEREALRLSGIDLGFVDACRRFHETEQFTWWDYRTAAFQRNRGWRIDHHYLSAELCARLQSCEVDIAPRQLEKPSDHAPVIVELA